MPATTTTTPETNMQLKQLVLALLAISIHALALAQYGFCQRSQTFDGQFEPV
jgi:hypothetical protein